VTAAFFWPDFELIRVQYTEIEVIVPVGRNCSGQWSVNGQFVGDGCGDWTRAGRYPRYIGVHLLYGMRPCVGGTYGDRVGNCYNGAEMDVTASFAVVGLREEGRTTDWRVNRARVDP